jgi:parallel beta-helix repeat protein
VTEFITVQNCFVHNSALTGIFLAFSYHPTIIHNESSFNGEHGVYQSNSGDYPIISSNRLHHNAAAGLHMNGDRNFTPGDGIISFAVVEKNIVYENGVQGGSGINCDGVNDSIIRNNLLYNNHASGISLYAIDGAEGSSRNLVYNNTIVMAQGARWCVNIPASTEGQANPTGNKVKNNILYTADSNRGSVVTYMAAPPGFESDYNVVANRFSTDDGDSSIALSSWQSGGLDLHSIVADPASLFVNPSGGDYHLKANSPAVAAGIVLAQVSDDLDGSPRPAGSCSIGCLEARPGQPAQDFSPTGLDVETGKLLSGDPSSVAATDGVYLKVKASRLDGNFGDVITYDFQLTAGAISSVSVISVSHASAAPQRQRIMQY